MDVDSVLEYCASKPTIAAALGGKDNKNNWSAKEVGDGNINFVYIVSCSATKNAVVVKQGLPFVRVVGESWPLTQERVRYEAEALQTAHGFCPKHVPEVFLYDPKMSVIAMRFLRAAAHHLKRRHRGGRDVPAPRRARRRVPGDDALREQRFGCRVRAFA
jgi:5-methylthioribose kinase